MTSADFLVYRNAEPNPGSPRVRAYSFLQFLRHLLNEHLLIRLHKAVLACPSHSASVCRFCSSVPDFAVSLPSDLRSPATPLRLANRLRPRMETFHRIERTNAPVRDFHSLEYSKNCVSCDTGSPMPGTHNVYKKEAKHQLNQGFWLVSNFVLIRKFSASKSPTFHILNVGGNAKTDKLRKNISLI